MATDALTDPPDPADASADGGPDDEPRPRRHRDWKAAGLCLASGGLLALSLPPWGFWPLAFVGIAGLDLLLARRPVWSRFRRGSLVGFGLLAPTMFWIKDMTLPGYVIAALLSAAIVGLFLAACPPGAGRRLGLPAAWLLAEAFRGAWPFGGVPLSVLAVGQVGGPLASVARVGGTLLIAGLTVAVGVALSAALTRSWTAAAASIAVVIVVTLLATAAPSGTDTGQHLSVAIVQGGGQQGTRSLNTNMSIVMNRHVVASARVPVGTNLTLWPEDVVDTDRYVVDTGAGDQLAQLARRLHTTLIVGVVEDEGETHFHNASMVYDPQGEVIDRYEKVHRVPFGEWVPLRELIPSSISPYLPQRDAVVGKGPATLTTPYGKLAVVISWEVFFGNRARDGVLHGGELLINPTNGSSFTGTLVQTQQVASSRLRAIETGRWVAQIAPTGFSAFVTPGGKVLERTAQKVRVVRLHEVQMRRGLTLYTRLGDMPFVVLGLLVLAAAWLVDRRSRETAEPAATT